ncbi:MAG TPA: hypothetical protein VEL03_03840 [Streptosporangiaceae bacterium]|nr:hypothetical protein [Streptosporangiaceae bacterium]
MHAADDSTTASRSAMGRLITPRANRHRRAIASVRFAVGGFNLGIGVVLLVLGHRAGTDQERRKGYGWAAWFLASAALQFSLGYHDMAVARSVPPRT